MKTWMALLPLTLAACTTTSYMRDAKPGPPPFNDEAKVIVYRTSEFGGGDHFPIYEYEDCDGRLLGFTENDRFFEVRCAPGKHLFLTWGEGDAFIEADLEPGKTYFIRAYSKFGITAARPGFAPVARDSEEWRQLDEILPTLRCRELDPAKAEEFERRKEDRLKQAQAKYEEGRKAPRYLKPEDGRVDATLPAK